MSKESNKKLKDTTFKCDQYELDFQYAEHHNSLVKAEREVLINQYSALFDSI